MNTRDGTRMVAPAADSPAPSSIEEMRRLLHLLVNDEWRARRSLVGIRSSAGMLRESCAAAALTLMQDLSLAQCTPGGRAPRTVQEFAQVLAGANRRLTGRAPLPVQQRITIAPWQQDAPVPEPRAFARLLAAVRRLHRATGCEVIVHGSLATGDWTVYSDADLLVLLPDPVATSAEGLENLRREMGPVLRALHRFDPLQHHGCFVLAMAEVGRWPEHHLPLAALACARHLTGDGLVLHVSPRLDQEVALQGLDWCVTKFRQAMLNKDRLANAYLLKAWTSVVMLMPALYQTAVGSPCYKRESFAMVEPLVPGELWEIQHFAAKLRRDWIRPGLVPRLLALLPTSLRNAAVTRIPTLRGAGAVEAASRHEQAHALASFLYELAVRQRHGETAPDRWQPGVGSRPVPQARSLPAGGLATEHGLSKAAAPSRHEEVDQR